MLGWGGGVQGRLIEPDLGVGGVGMSVATVMKQMRGEGGWGMARGWLDCTRLFGFADLWATNCWLAGLSARQIRRPKVQPFAVGRQK